MSSKFLDSKFELDNIAYDLQELARAFNRIGNSDIARELNEYAMTILAHSEIMRGENHKEMYSHFQQIQEHETNILQACLAGVTIGSKFRKDNNESA